MPAEVLERPSEPLGTQDRASTPGDAVPAAGRRWPRVVVRALAGFVAFLLVGNGLILGSTLWFRWATPAAATPPTRAEAIRLPDAGSR